MLQTVYYYFLGLKIGNEHKSMFYRTQPKHELPRGKKNALRYIWSSFVSCTYPEYQFHILCIFWTLQQLNVACLYSCLFHFLFYKVNLILLQKYLHVTIVRVGIWMHEYLWIIISFWIRGFTLIGNLIGKSGVALAKYQITHQKMWCPVPYHVTHK